MTEICVSPGDFSVYQNIGGHPYGAVFSEQFAFEKHPELCLELWGFADTKDEAICNLMVDTEEWNAIYKGIAIRFKPI